MSINKRKRISQDVEMSDYSDDDLSSEMEDLKMEDVVVETSIETEVGRVVNHRINRDGTWSFRVRWKGYGSRDDEWVLDSDCNCEKKIAEYMNIVALKTIYCFCRVSSKSQSGVNHVSLPAQARRLIRDARSQRENQSVRIKVFKVTGSAYSRIPTKLAQIGEAANEGDTIMVYRADRLSRNIIRYLSWMEDLSERGVRFFATDDNLWYHRDLDQKDKLDFIQAVVTAHRESAVLSRRILASVEERRERGDEHIGGLAYGKMYQRQADGHLTVVENPYEKATIVRICRSDSDHPVMAETLNREGNKKRNKKWNSGMVKYIREKHR